MGNVMQIDDYFGKNSKEDINLFTLKQFKRIMNGSGFDDEEFEIHLHQFEDPFDGYNGDWWISFVDPENDSYCVVAQDGFTNKDDFVLYFKPMKEMVKMLNTLEKCERNAILHYELE